MIIKDSSWQRQEQKQTIGTLTGASSKGKIHYRQVPDEFGKWEQ